MSPAEPQEVYYAGVFTHRRVVRLLFGMLFLGICGSVAFLCANHLFSTEQHTLCEIGGPVFGLGISGLMAYFGGTMLVAYFTNHQPLVQIDGTGVTYGGHHYFWKEIGSLRGQWSGSKVQLMFNKQGKGFLLNRHLWTDKGLTEQEYNLLINRLEREVLPSHLHLKLDRAIEPAD